MRYTEHVLEDAKMIYDFLADVPALPERADFILAAGTRDLRVAAHAAELYMRGLAPVLICSGGFGKLTMNAFSRPEAEQFAALCVEYGVPKEAILIENRSKNTGENFLFSKELCKNRNYKLGVVACKPYAAKRVWAAGTKQWPEVRWYASGIPLRFEEYPSGDITLEDTIQLMVGDLQRLRIYERAGYQVHIDIPEKIWGAYESLVQAGFDRYVIREVQTRTE